MLTALKMFAVVVILGLVAANYQQGQVIAGQKQLIRQMATNPECMVAR